MLLIPLYKVDYNTCYHVQIKYWGPKEIVICYDWGDWKRQLERVRKQKEDIQNVVEH